MIQVNDRHTMYYTVPAGKGVPDLFPESAIFTAMPPVFATGFLVGLMEWGCLEHLNAAQHHGSGEMTLGLGVDIVHDAPCTEGAGLEVRCVCTHVGTRSLTWSVEVYCRDVLMGHGTHKRVIVNRQQFAKHVNEQAARIGGQPVA